MKSVQFKLSALVVGATLVAAGIAGTLLVQRVFKFRSTGAPAAPAGIARQTTTAEPQTSVSLTPDVIARAGIRTALVSSGAAGSSLRAPGSVEVDAYRQVIVTPIVAGRVTNVPVELGAEVREGQTLAEIFSPELADAERAYLTARTDAALADQRRQRIEKLAGIGAVSQQEIEDVRADYARQTQAVESVRARLRVMGLEAATIDALRSAGDISAMIRVTAPAAGVVVKRTVNRGQNVDPSMELMTVADLSSVWVIADVFERDAAHVAVGSSALVTTGARPADRWTGRVGYIDSQVSTDTRSLKARIELQNPRRKLLPGMLVDVELSDASHAERVMMPGTAAQHVGARTVVFVSTSASGDGGTYQVREVQLGRATGELAEVLHGVNPGDRVVTDGAFALRAEWERTGGRLPSAPEPGAESAPSLGRTPAPSSAAAVQHVTLRITENGFEPPTIKVEAGRPIELVVTRATDKTCGTEIVVGNNRQRADLPLNRPVTIRVPALSKGELQLTCGMSMLKGVLIAREP